MAIHLFDCPIAGTPSEPRLLEEVTTRLIEDWERERFDEELATKHYLKNANAVGRVLRYVAEYRGQWVALLMFNSAAYQLKPRDRWLHWVGPQVAQRRHLIGQSSRFLVLAAPGKMAQFGVSRLEAGVRALAQRLAGALWLSSVGAGNLRGPATVSGYLLQSRRLTALSPDKSQCHSAFRPKA